MDFPNTYRPGYASNDSQIWDCFLGPKTALRLPRVVPKPNRPPIILCTLSQLQNFRMQTLSTIPASVVQAFECLSPIC